MNQALAITTIILLTGILIGCAQQIENPGKMLGSPTVEDTRSTELQRVQFADVPVPHGFELVPRGNRSYSFQGGGVRLARYRYWGKQSPEDVASFYRRTMALDTYGWNPTTETSEQGQSTLAFAKDQDSCIVTILEEAGATVIRVNVSGQD